MTTAVFIPVTFMTGPVGVFYRQFGLTMAMSIVLSGVVALTLTAVLCAMLLKLHDPHRKRSRSPLAILLHLVDRGIEKITGGYVGILSRIVTQRTLTVLIIVAFGVGIFMVNTVLPTGFIPPRRPRHHLRHHPDGAGVNARIHQRQVLRTASHLRRAGRGHFRLVARRLRSPHGRSRLQRGQLHHQLETWSERKLTSKQIIEELEEKGREIANVKLEFYEPPAVPGFGAAGGFSLNLLDKTNSGNYAEMGKITDKFMEALAKRKEL